MAGLHDLFESDLRRVFYGFGGGPVPEELLLEQLRERWDLGDVSLSELVKRPMLDLTRLSPVWYVSAEAMSRFKGDETDTLIVEWLREHPLSSEAAISSGIAEATGVQLPSDEVLDRLCAEDFPAFAKEFWAQDPRWHLRVSHVAEEEPSDQPLQPKLAQLALADSADSAHVDVAMLLATGHCHSLEEIGAALEEHWDVDLDALHEVLLSDALAEVVCTHERLWVLEGPLPLSRGGQADLWQDIYDTLMRCPFLSVSEIFQALEASGWEDLTANEVDAVLNDQEFPAQPYGPYFHFDPRVGITGVAEE